MFSLLAKSLEAVFILRVKNGLFHNLLLARFALTHRASDDAMNISDVAGSSRVAAATDVKATASVLACALATASLTVSLLGGLSLCRLPA